MSSSVLGETNFRSSSSMLSSFFSNENYALKAYPQHAIMTMVGSIIFHTFLVFVFYGMSSVLSSTFRSMTFPKKINWVSRLVSNVHAIISFGGALWAIIMTAECYKRWDVVASCFDYEAGYLTLQYTIGYFTYDLVFMLLFYKELGGIGLVLHHFFGIVGWGLILSYENFSFFALLFTLTEATTPFVNQRWFLYESGMKDKPIYSVFGFLLWLSWSLVRMPLVPFTFMYIMYNWEDLAKAPFAVPFVCIFNYILITALNTYWYYLISKGLLSVLFGKKKTATSTMEKKDQ
ncbi:hypothetical protein C9374_008280 [Naegleria lovaniensis]|uniref:TLC domain-containing protein n=1 Tax=Naegleria lovaniensis TaxID=51637 RepID=A0AA88KHX1_NAELO|nr:uncharacterized protein C9374_008280 [Naegleria lovaniensis]KAG2378641.1 hypothetical protein C9374_008280 [Naegleria lovaniensis]